MCEAYEMRCHCGNRSASFQFRDNVLSHEIIRKLYCPECSPEVDVNGETMIVDNGWVIEYDMDIARFMGQLKIGSGKNLTSDLIFDEGYCTWNGIYPGDHIDSVTERAGITALSKTDPLRYLKEMKAWAEERMGRLRREGWRKACEGQ